MGQGKVRQKSQAENSVKKKGGVRGVPSRCREKQDRHATQRKGTKSRDIA